jgi:hypothetical protein
MGSSNEKPSGLTFYIYYNSPVICPSCNFICKSSLFLLIAEHYSMVQIHQSLFSHLSFERYVGCFQIVSIMNKAAISIHAHVGMNINIHVSEIHKYPGV